MSESKFTPGPWTWGSGWDAWTPGDDDEYDADQKYLDLRLIGGNGGTILPLRIDHYNLEVDHGGKDSFLTPADRALIAAAPDLLEACEKAEAGICDWRLGKAIAPKAKDYVAAVLRDLRAAIAKAEGR